MKWPQLATPAGAILILLALGLLLGGAPHAFAADNLVRVQPSGVNVAPGGTFTVSIVDDPSPATTAVWAIDVVYDPDVLTTSTDECDPMDTPGGGIGAFDCQAVDANEDGKDETVKVLGVFLYSGTGKGLDKESDLADITFHATGRAGACSDLHLRIRNHADSDGKETGALVQDGRVCINAEAPPSGTATANPVTPRTSEPTPPGETTPPIGLPTGAPAESQQSGPPAQSGVTGTTSANGRPTGRTSSPAAPSGGEGASVDGGDGGGTSPAVWVVVGLAVLAAVAGGAWGIVRLRGRTGSDAPPPDGSALS